MRIVGQNHKYWQVKSLEFTRHSTDLTNLATPVSLSRVLERWHGPDSRLPLDSWVD